MTAPQRPVRAECESFLQRKASRFPPFKSIRETANSFHRHSGRSIPTALSRCWNSTMYDDCRHSWDLSLLRGTLSRAAVDGAYCRRKGVGRVLAAPPRAGWLLRRDGSVSQFYSGAKGACLARAGHLRADSRVGRTRPCENILAFAVLARKDQQSSEYAALSNFEKRQHTGGWKAAFKELTTLIRGTH